MPLVYSQNRKYIPSGGKGQPQGRPFLPSPVLGRKQKTMYWGIRLGGWWLVLHNVFVSWGRVALLARAPLIAQLVASHTHTPSPSLSLIPYPSNSACHHPY